MGSACSFLDEVLVHCHDDGRTICLANISRSALEDFGVQGGARIPLKDWNLLVHRNLSAFGGSIIEEKLRRGSCKTGQVRVTLKDVRRSREAFTVEVLDLNANTGFRPS